MGRAARPGRRRASKEVRLARHRRADRSEPAGAGGDGCVRVLYVNHTALVSGSERSLLSLLGGLPDSVKAHVATPPGPLAQAVEDLGIPVSSIAATAGSLRLHPAYTPRALGELSLAALQVRRVARRHR